MTRLAVLFLNFAALCAVLCTASVRSFDENMIQGYLLMLSVGLSTWFVCLDPMQD